MVIKKSPFEIGRVPSLVDYAIQDGKYASRVHATITRSGTSFIVTDTKSSHGTWVNRVPISSFELRNDDVIGIAVTELRVRFHATLASAELDARDAIGRYERESASSMTPKPPRVMLTRPGSVDLMAVLHRSSHVLNSSPLAVFRRVAGRGDGFVACFVRIDHPMVIEQLYGQFALSASCAEIARALSFRLPPSALMTGISPSEIAVVTSGAWSRADHESLLETVRALVPHEALCEGERVPFTMTIEVLGIEDAVNRVARVL